MSTPKLKRVMRLDSMPLTRAYFTSEGFLIDKPVVTSCGIFEYANPDGSIRRELRLPEDVFAPESLKSYRGKPIIISHDAGLIDNQNVAENQIGTILSDGERKNDDVVCDIIIHDTGAMNSCGFKELSLGYNLDLDETPGEWNGQHYDAIQKNIVINHLALVREARAGDQARLNLDGRDSKVLKGGKTMGAKNSRIRSTHHGDDVLTQEEFEKAIDEYKKMKAGRGGAQTDADELQEEQQPQTQVQTTNMPAAGMKSAAPAEQKPSEVEMKVKAVRERRDLRDEAGDPRDEEEALTTIANQDEDLDVLFDIIDTLLARQDFNAQAPAASAAQTAQPVPAQMDANDVDDDMEDGEDTDVEDETAMDGCEVGGVDEMNKESKYVASDEDDTEDMELEDDEMATDEDDTDIEGEEEEEFAEDADDEELPADDEDVEDDEFAEDADDVVEEEEEEEKTIDPARMDSAISRGIRTHMMLGNLGRKVGIKNLEYKNVMSAKKAIIKAVRPDMRLDGKSETYINSAFDYAKKEIRARSKKDVSYQRRQMFNKDSRESVASHNRESAASARERMIKRHLGNK